MDSSGRIHALTDPEITDEQLEKMGLTPIRKEDEERVRNMTTEERLAWLAQERTRRSSMKAHLADLARERAALGERSLKPKR